MSIKSHEHFVPESSLPQIEGSAPLRDVFERVGRSGQGGFIVLRDGRPRVYVKSAELAAAVVKNEKGGVPSVSGTSVNVVLERPYARSAVVPLAFSAADADPADLAVGPDKVFVVEEEAAGPAGFFLNHENVYASTVRRPVFVCEKGHENPTLGDGTCGFCPFPIIGVGENGNRL